MKITTPKSPDDICPAKMGKQLKKARQIAGPFAFSDEWM
jgi:hypothetical protein